jgi:hypothetical protein
VLLHLWSILVAADDGAPAGVGGDAHAAHERDAVAGPERPAGGARRDALAVDEGAVEALVEEQRAAAAAADSARLPADGAVAAAHAQVVGRQVEAARLASEDVGFVCGGELRDGRICQGQVDDEMRAQREGVGGEGLALISRPSVWSNNLHHQLAAFCVSGFGSAPLDSNVGGIGAGLHVTALVRPEAG